MRKTRAERVEALEEWASYVDSAELKVADTTVVREIAKLADQRSEVGAELIAAVWSARRARSAIGAMLGVSKQAAQRKYASKTVTVGSSFSAVSVASAASTGVRRD